MATVPDEEMSVLGPALQRLYASLGERLVLGVRTIADVQIDDWPEMGPAEAAPSVRETTRTTPGEPSPLAQATADWQAKSTYPRCLGWSLDAGFPHAFVSQREIDALFASGAPEEWDEFYLKFPGAAGLTSVTRVGFSADRTRALFLVEHRFSDLGAEGRLVLLEQRDEVWSILRSFILWIA